MQAEGDRARLMAEIGGTVCFDGILNAAVERAKRRAREQGRSDSLYGTWHEHVSTNGRVWEEFKGILDDLKITDGPGRPLLEELNRRYGTGATLYHA
jgi:hypothetical protein